MPLPMEHKRFNYGRDLARHPGDSRLLEGLRQVGGMKTIPPRLWTQIPTWTTLPGVHHGPSTRMGSMYQGSVRNSTVAGRGLGRAKRQLQHGKRG